MWAVDDDEWNLDLEEVFENYSNTRKWSEHGVLLGLVFGVLSAKHISKVLFCLPCDINSTADLARFALSSFSSEVTFIGIMSLVDGEYAFDVRTMNVLMSGSDTLLHLIADNKTLLERDVKGFLEFNDMIKFRFRRSASTSVSGLTARVTLQLDLFIRADDPSGVTDELTEAVEEESEYAGSMCFYHPQSGSLLGDGISFNGLRTIFPDVKKPEFDKNFIEFIPMRSVSSRIADDFEPNLVPVVKIKKGLCAFQNMRSSVTAYTVLQLDSSYTEIVELLRIAVKRALHLAERCIYDLSSLGVKDFVGVDSYAFVVGNNLISAYYPRVDDESFLRSYRSKLHRIFNFSFEKPLLRPSQSLRFDCHRTVLRNPHLHITNYKPLGTVSCVKGSYDYHHYMQDGYNDSGWGCAYRSFQTIWSWFALQGYTDKNVPSHKDIQQSLYACGDKDEKFVGSRQWIGSTELSYCLENMLGIESRIISTNSGKEVAENARQLAVHFETRGSPIMIGGGMLAHTILGVDFNDLTGDCAFLVLDPHYSGEDVIQTIVSKGWCAWKKPDFWKAEHFYNLLLPIPPHNVI